MHTTPTPTTTITTIVQDLVDIAKVMEDSLDDSYRMTLATQQGHHAEANRLQDSAFDLDQKAQGMLDRFEEVHGISAHDADEDGGHWFMPAHPTWTART